MRIASIPTATRTPGLFVKSHVTASDESIELPEGWHQLGMFDELIEEPAPPPRRRKAKPAPLAEPAPEPEAFEPAVLPVYVPAEPQPEVEVEPEPELDPLPTAPAEPVPVIVIGAGPSGLTAAHGLSQREIPVHVYEAGDQVGGAWPTVRRDGWRFDLGAHRFAVAATDVQDLWRGLFDPDDLVELPRQVGAAYRNHLIDFPPEPGRAPTGIGKLRAALSYAAARANPPKDRRNAEAFLRARFGERVHGELFRPYTEKMWGVRAAAMDADFARTELAELALHQGGAQAYPRDGAGATWDRLAEGVVKMGGRLTTGAWIEQLHREAGVVTAVTVADENGRRRVDVAAVVSSMPLQSLVEAMEPAAPRAVRQAAQALRYRDVLTVVLVVPRAFNDGWLYVPQARHHVGRVQNYGVWWEQCAVDGYTALGLEYFTDEGDPLWSMPDQDLYELAGGELANLGLAREDRVRAGYVIRTPLAYPVPDLDYQVSVGQIMEWLATAAANVYPVGCSGQHRYGGLDHSIRTGLSAADQVYDNHRQS